MKLNVSNLNLALARQQRTNTDVMKTAKISSATYYKAVKGEYIAPKTIGKIAKALNVEPEYLIEEV